jgi:hypothetical protein
LHIPIIDVSNLDTGGSAQRNVAEQLGAGCRKSDLARAPARAAETMERFLGGGIGRVGHGLFLTK